MKRPDEAPQWDIALDAASGHARRWLTSLRERPVGPADDFVASHQKLNTPMPVDGEDAGAVIDTLARLAEPGLTAMGSPRFYGWVIGGSQPVGIAADWLVTAWDQNTCLAEATPATSAIEAATARWLLQLFDLHRESSIAFVTGGQMANTTCLAAARSSVLRSHDWNVETDGLAGAPQMSVIVGDARHHTIDRAVRLLGIGSNAIVTVAVDDQARMNPSGLAEALAQCNGPTIVCAQAGQINTGAVDPLDMIADVVAEHRRRRQKSDSWLHIDGAIGLWGRSSSRLSPQFAGCERADSWSTDAHKWLNTPYDCGIAIVRDPAAHRAAMSLQADYLGESPVNRSPHDWTPELSRRARAVPVYATLRHLGTSGVAAMIERSCDMAARFARLAVAINSCEVLNDVRLNQVLVGVEDDALAVADQLQRDGVCFPTTTMWHGRPALRFSFCNWQTDISDVERTIDALERSLAAV